MPKDKQKALDAMAKIPGLELLMSLVEKMPDAAEYQAMTEEFEAQMEISLQEAMNYNPDDTPPVPTAKKEGTEPAPVPVAAPAAIASGTQLVGIRIPRVVVAAFKAKAKEKGVPYQRLMNRELRLIAAGFKSPSALV